MNYFKFYPIFEMFENILKTDRNVSKELGQM